MAVIAAVTLTATIYSEYAAAYPEGAPWGAANPGAAESCSSCHFGSEPVMNSDALTVEGLPEQPAAGVAYPLRIGFDHPDAETSGFQLIVAADGSRAGNFSSNEEDIEFVGEAVRSTSTKKVADKISWTVTWLAPDVINLPLVFYLAASASNDDLSPFGDTIHYRRYEITGSIE